jgi:NADPH2:quinone reductase
MGADDQNVEVGIMGAGSGKPPASRSAFPPGAAAGTAAVPGTMRAAVLDAPGPPSALAIRELPVPVPSAGQVLIKVRAFGLNRLELYLRLGLSEGVTFPRVPGIEAVGVVAECPGGEFSTGQQVAALMGGMGRVFDGGYADYTCVPAAQVIPFRSDLDWATLGAVPEMLQTSYGSLTTGLEARPGQSILIRGGTSSVGLATAVLARQRGMTVLATTRNPGKAGAVTKAGADHVLIDDGHVARQVREILPGGADAALELVGTPTLPDTLRSVRIHGVVCFTGMLSNQWTVHDFYPLEYLPTGVRLTAYKGDAADLPPRVLQDFLDAVAAGTAAVPIGRVYRFDQIAEAHTDMEQNRASGKLVVTT